MTQIHENIVGLDSGILMHPSIWEASGHVGAFNDPLVDCKTCKARYRADEFSDDFSSIDWNGVRRGFKMLLSHRAPSSLNMSSYRAIWTHFRPNFIFSGQKNLRLPKIQTFPEMQISSSSHAHKYLTYMGR